MNKITLLPEEVANKIAAGEVIERPASIVKELVENSIDSGAKKIKIEISNAGVDEIKITDDGCGIPVEDLYYLKLILNDKATEDEAQGFRSILRAKRLNFQNSTFQPVHPEIIIALEAKMDTKLGSRETKE